MRCEQRSPLGPVFEIAELVELLNGVSRPRGDGRPRWDRWNVVSLLRTRDVELVQRARRGKYYVTLAGLRGAFPDLYDSILDCSALQDSAAA